MVEGHKEYGYGFRWRYEQRGEQCFGEKEEKKVGSNKQAFLFFFSFPRFFSSFCSPRLSQVQAGIFILAGENANHQSQAACYVSV